MNKNILEINYFHIELGHTLEEYKEQFETLYEEGDLWDYSLEDVKTNAVEGNCNVLYWGIVVDEKLRVFEKFCKISKYILHFCKRCGIILSVVNL